MTSVLVAREQVEKIIYDVIDGLIGDTPVSEQIEAAVDQMAPLEHVQALRKEVQSLQQQLDTLTNLVGDVAVSEQIQIAIESSKQV